MILSDEVQKSLDILDQVLSEFEDVPSSSESTTAFSSLCDDGSEKGDNRTKKEVYFGVSTVERSMLQGHGKDLKDQSVSNSVSKLEKNLERIRLVQQNSVTNTDFLKVSNDDNIKPTTRCDQSQEILDNNNEAIVPKNLLSFWLDREERTKAECSPTLPKGKEQEQNAKNTPPSKLPKPTNIVKPISKADQFLDSRLPKSKIPVSCDARNTDKLSASKHPSDLQKTKVFKIPAENKVGDRIKFCSNSANEELSNILKPNLREELNDQRFKSLQPKKESMVCDINKTGRSTAIIFQEESKKISEIPVIDSNIEKFGSSPPSKSDICFIQSGSLSEKIRTVEQFSSTSSLNQERGGREKLLSEKKTATLQCNDNYCVSEGDMIEKSSQPYEVCERSVALKPPIENLAEDPCISDKSKEDLVNPQKELKRTTSSDSQTPSQKTTQSTQTTPPCVKQSKWSFSVEPCNSSAIENPQIRHKKRPYSVSPIYSVLDPRSDFEVRYPAQTNMFHSRQHLCPINDGYVATNGFFPQHLHRSLSVSQFMSMEDQIYQQLSIPESPTVLRSAQEKLHMHELQQISRGNNHFLHRMSHAYHKNQRHSINLEHIMSLEQLDVRKAQFQAHARSFNKRSKSFLENKADTRSLENQRKRSHKKPDSSQRNVMKVMAQNKFDEELEYMTSDSQKFAPIIKDKFIKNANIYLPSSPILQLQENCNDESDDKEISDDQNHPFQNSHLSRKMSNDSLCSTKTVEESFRLNRSRSSTSFEYLPENKNGEYLMDSDSPASEKTQKTLVSSSEEITTLRQLISEGIIKLDEVPPGFVPPPPPANIYKHDRDKQRKSHQINVEDNSFVSLSPVAKPSKVLKPIKSLELDNLHRKRLQSNMSKSTENLFRNGFQDKKIPGSGKKEGPLETDDKRQGETKKKNFLFSFWKRKQYTIDPL